MNEPNIRIVRESTITCPACGHSAPEIMPTDACLWYYECPGCHELLRPRSGDCCVFCSYGTAPCPPVQQNGRSCCSSGRRAGETG